MSEPAVSPVSGDPTLATIVTTTPPVPAAPAPASPPVEEWDRDRAARTIEAQRASEKVLKAELAEARKAQEKLAQIEAEKLSAEERAKQEAETAKAQLATAQDSLRRGYLLAELAKPEYGLVDAEAAAALITDIQYGDDSKPANAADRVTALLEQRPFLKAGTPPPPAAPNLNPGQGGSNQPPPALTADELQMAKSFGMTAEEYAQYKEPQQQPVATPASQ